MENMPKRIVFTKTVKDDRLLVKQINVGTVMDANESDFYAFSQNYPGCFSVVEMTEQDWIDLATTNFLDSKDKLEKLTAISEGMGLGITVSDSIHYYSGLVPAKDGKVSSVYGLSDIYHKSKYYKGFVDEFERKIGEQLSIEKNKTL
ncbi:MAG: hypothetical protein ACI4OG_02760 [Bacilli bacterium]